MAHSIHSLVGKTITKIEVMDVDLYGDGEQVIEVHRFTCSDGTMLHFAADAGDGPQYSTFNLCEMNDSGTLPKANTGDYTKIIQPFRDSSELDS